MNMCVHNKLKENKQAKNKVREK
jgi:hypothetical protein